MYESFDRRTKEQKLTVPPSKLCPYVLMSESFDRRTKEQKTDNTALKIMSFCSCVGIFIRANGLQRLTYNL